MDNEIIKAINKKTDTPFYIYNYEKIKDRFEKLKEAIPSCSNIYYSVKANPSLAICQVMNQLTQNAEVSSLGELYCALKSGFQNENILFSGPGKTKKELYTAIKNGIKINVESNHEICLINDICKEYNLTSDISIRVNPDFSIAGNGITMSGTPSQFGLDISEFEIALKIIKQSDKLHLTGISVYMGSQILEAKIIIENSKNILKLFITLQNKYNLQMKDLNFGGGFGVSYFDSRALDLNLLNVGLIKLFDEYKSELQNINTYFESGRFLIADSGSLITKILYRKSMKGRQYLICDGGINNSLIAAYFSREVRGNFPISLIDNIPKKNLRTPNEYYITGPLCTPNDLLGCKVTLPEAEVGDYIKIDKTGAYGFTFSPIWFISHATPAEILIKGTSFYVIREQGDHEDFFRNQLPVQITEVLKNVNE